MMAQWLQMTASLRNSQPKQCLSFFEKEKFGEEVYVWASEKGIKKQLNDKKFIICIQYSQ